MTILAVVVLYKTPIDKSQTLNGLSDVLLKDSELSAAYSLLIWDNSPEALEDPSYAVPFTYRHSSWNCGVSGAYNEALAIAEELDLTWMLMLDQDTHVTREFLVTMLHHARALATRKDIAAIVPTVRSRGIVVSPKRQLFARNARYPVGICGIADGEAIAINSGCVVRVSSLRIIGGFSSEFWLDYSDLYVFHQLFKRNMRVWRAADALLQHEMSIMDYDRLMTPWRYKNFSYAETAFHDLYKGRLENAIQTCRLFARALKQRVKYKNPEYSRIAWRQWGYRMTTSKKHRIDLWHKHCTKRASI